MLIFNSFTLNKETGKVFKNGIAGNAKIQIIFLTEDIVVIKQSGSTSYTDRDSGYTYLPSIYEIYSVKEIKNYKKDIIIYLKDFIGEVEVKKINNMDIINKINNKYPIEKPKLSKIESEYAEAINRNNLMLEELMLNSQNIKQERIRL